MCKHLNIVDELIVKNHDYVFKMRHKLSHIFKKDN